MASQSLAIPAANITDWPWRVYRAETPPNRLSVCGGRGSSICTIWTHDDDLAWCNAHMLRSAPELYRELARLRETLGPDEAVDLILRKARGEWRP